MTDPRTDSPVDSPIDSLIDSPIDRGHSDRHGRAVTLRAVDADNWRAVADVAPRDDQREFAPALAARYLLLGLMEDSWSSLAICADDTVVGHAMWAVDDDGSHWIGGVLVDAAEQGSGVGRAAMTTLVAWLAVRPSCSVVRLSYDEQNTPAARLYRDLGFVATGVAEGDEVVVELRV